MAGVTNTYTDISIPVEAGDFLGLRMSANGACGDINPAAGGYVDRYTSQDPAPNTAVMIPALAADDVRLDISATLEADADGDGLGDETEDADDDGDGDENVADNCASVANPDQANIDGDAQGDACDDDDDGDGDGDVADNCTSVANPDQADIDGDAQGDACDADDDGDGVADVADNCPSVANPGQANADGDALGDACDGAPGPGTPGPGTPGPGTPGGPTRDTTKPVLSVPSMSSSVFQAAGSGPAFAAKIGTRVSFTVSEASSVKFTVQRKTKGRRVAGTCRRQTRSNRTRKPCTRWVAVKGSFSIPAATGATSFTFRGRIGDKKLRPGSYRLNSRATDAANNKSGITRKAFRIVK